MGSMLTKRWAAGGMLAIRSSSASLVTVVPYQKLLPWGRSATCSSALYRSGYLVRNIYLCWGAASQASNTSTIQRVGTVGANRSPMLHTKMLAGFFFCAGIASR